MTTPPGWYHAEGDPPGTQRYWNGTTWDGGPQPATTPGFGSRPSAMWAESSQATLALILSILGLVVCGILGPVGAWLGRKEQQAIDAGRRDPANRGTATAAFWIGLVSTAFLVLGFLAVIFFLVVGGLAAVSEAGLAAVVAA